MVYVTKGQKELKRTWPHEKGLIAETTTQEGRVMNLIPVTSKVLRKDRAGL